MHNCVSGENSRVATCNTASPAKTRELRRARELLRRKSHCLPAAKARSPWKTRDFPHAIVRLPPKIATCRVRNHVLPGNPGIFQPHTPVLSRKIEICRWQLSLFPRRTRPVRWIESLLTRGSLGGRQPGSAPARGKVQGGGGMGSPPSGGSHEAAGPGAPPHRGRPKSHGTVSPPGGATPGATLPAASPNRGRRVSHATCFPRNRKCGGRTL